MAEVVSDEVPEGVSVGLTARDKGDGRWEPEGGYRNPGHPPGTKNAKPLLCIGN